jgi:hypothetical protein
MRLLVSSANGANGAGYGAVLAFDAAGNGLGTFCDDSRVADPRGVCVDPSGELLYVNNGDGRVLAVDRQGEVQKDTGPINALDPGGGVFGPDGRYYVGSRRLRTVMALPARLDGPAIPYLPQEVVPFPRGFASLPMVAFSWRRASALRASARTPSRCSMLTASFSRRAWSTIRS